MIINERNIIKDDDLPLNKDVVQDDNSSVVTPLGIKHRKLEGVSYNNTSRIKELYHAVFNKRSYDYVIKNGITKDSDGWIYLSEKPYKNAYAVFKVRIPDNNRLYDWRELWCDDEGNEIDSDHQYDRNNPYYMYSGNIPRDYITEYK